MLCLGRGTRLKASYLLEATFAGFAALFGGGVAKAGGIRGRWRRKAALLSNGRPVMTAFREAELIDTVTQNDRHPYRIVTAWDNPLTGEKVLFRSEHVWKDPTDLLKQRSICRGDRFRTTSKTTSWTSRSCRRSSPRSRGGGFN
jgi:hypothetical protein